MKRLLKPAHFDLISAGLAGISLLVFSAVISPYTAASHLLRSLKLQLQSTVAADRFVGYFALACVTTEAEECLYFKGRVPPQGDPVAEAQH
jgi:hypothetical protein